MKIFDFYDYKEFLNAWVAEQPKKGRGVLQQISKTLQVHPTFVSHVVRADKDFSPEQGLALAQFLGLTAQEEEYLIYLIQYARAGTTELKSLMKKRLDSFRSQETELSSRLAHRELTDVETAEFYSSWHYSAVRLLTSLPHVNRLDDLAQYIELDTDKLNRILSFLKQTRLVVEEQGQLTMGTPSTHLNSRSPHVLRHHCNWRLKALELFPNRSEGDFNFTSPLSISKNGAAKFRQRLLHLIDELKSEVEAHEPDTLMLMNIDWMSLN